MSDSPGAERRRRRWVTLPEMVAVLGLVIGALTLGLNWSEKRDAAQEKAAASAAAGAAKVRLSLDADLARGGKEIRLSDARHELIDTAVDFPAALRIERQTPATARIDKVWFDRAVLAATDGGADEREGRLPVLVTARYMVGDTPREGHAVVEIIWRTQGRLVGGRSLEIEAVRVRETGGDRKRIDALWTAEMKRQSARA
ncbi:hypothetical protein SAMN05428950_101833 [Sphingomonas sp. OV641]|uniref:hypothetical protein n=1 Tax=Sphingomonas sp. OV641 TaxID=1881068 RepID=UPI0008C6B31C|nr:hypothetical protein [Sphingomonas sp. OV641]SEJ00739.1 hypothetical protein SAMN05428950_101833 [Sphingomonas sp. OV641]